MIKTREEKITTTRTVQECTICDFCGYTTDHRNEWENDPHALKCSAYFISETELSYSYGVRYPEGSSLHKYDIDICPVCFLNKIVPMLITNKEPEEIND